MAFVPTVTKMFCTFISFLNTTHINHLDLFTYLLTPWCRVLLEKLTGLQLVKKSPSFYGTRRFITAFTSFRHPSLSWASPTQSTCPQPTSCRSILILSTHLRLETNTLSNKFNLIQKLHLIYTDLCFKPPPRKSNRLSQRPYSFRFEQLCECTEISLGFCRSPDTGLMSVG